MWGCVGGVALLAVFGACSPWLLDQVADMPDDAESVEHSLGLLGGLALVAAACAGAVLMAALSSPDETLRRAGVLNAWAALIGVIFFFLPTPFWVGRLVTYALCIGAGAVYLLVVGRAVVVALRGRGKSAWTAPLAAAGVVANLALVALLMRWSSMGLDLGID